MPGVYDEHAQRDKPRLLKVALHQAAPAIPLLLADLGIAVAGQVGKVELAVDAEVVHLRGLAGGSAHPCEVLPVQQPVDDGGLAHVGASGKGHLGSTVPDKGVLGGGGQHELRLVEVDGHDGLLL